MQSASSKAVPAAHSALQGCILDHCIALELVAAAQAAILPRGINLGRTIGGAASSKGWEGKGEGAKNLKAAMNYVYIERGLTFIAGWTKQE